MPGENEMEKYSTSRNVLKAVLARVASHHVEMAKAHQAAMDPEEEGSSQAAFHQRAMDEHTAAGEDFVECCKSLDGDATKSDVGGVADELLAKLTSIADE